MPVDLSKFEGMTPGPWSWDCVPLPGVEPSKFDPNPKCWVLRGESAHEDGSVPVARHRAQWPVLEPDAAAIAAVADLIAEVRELRAERDRLLKAVQEAHRKLSLKKDGRGRCACVYCEVQAAKA
jgi:hypothetical protein